MTREEFLTKIWDLEKVDRPALILEEPKEKYPSWSVDLTNEEIFQSNYKKYLSLKDGRDDNIPTLDASIGTHILPIALGGEEKVFEDGHRYLEKPVINQASDVDKIKSFDLTKGAMGRQIELLKYFYEKTKGEVPIRLADIQNPLGVVDMMWETQDFYVSLYENPKEVHQLLKIATEAVGEFIEKMLDISENVVPITWPLVWAPKNRGIYLADDTMSMISPDMYEEYGVKYNNILSDAFGGVMLHSCTTNERYFDKIMMNKNIRSINFAAQYSSDMTKIYEYFGGKIVVIPHYNHTDSPQIGTVTEFLEKVISCWKPEYPSIIFIAQHPSSLTQNKAFDVYNAHFNI